MKWAIIILFLIGLALVIVGKRAGSRASQNDFSFVIPMGAGLAAWAIDAVLLVGYGLWRLLW